MSSDDAATVKPVYIPWKTFAAYVGGLKGTTLPHTLDSSVKPRAMSGGVWRQLLSALQFLGLVTTAKEVTAQFEALVGSYGDERAWADLLNKHVLPAYDPIVGDLPIDKATQGQLSEKFRSAGVDNQVLKKCMRFYVHLLATAGIKYSPHFSMRQESPTVPRKTAKKTKQEKPDATKKNSGDHGDPPPDATPKDMLDLPLPWKEFPGCFIRVSQKITPEQIPLFDTMANVVKQLAADNGSK